MRNVAEFLKSRADIIRWALAMSSQIGFVTAWRISYTLSEYGINQLTLLEIDLLASTGHVEAVGLAGNRCYRMAQSVREAVRSVESSMTGQPRPVPSIQHCANEGCTQIVPAGRTYCSRSCAGQAGARRRHHA